MLVLLHPQLGLRGLSRWLGKFRRRPGAAHRAVHGSTVLYVSIASHLRPTLTIPTSRNCVPRSLALLTVTCTLKSRRRTSPRSDSGRHIILGSSPTH